MKKASKWCILLLLCTAIFIPVPGLSVSGNTAKMNVHNLRHGIQVQLPSTMQVSENLLGEREKLLYSVNLNDEVLLLRGYIQIWQIEDVEKFLVTSKSMSSYEFYSYSLNQITIGSLTGLLNAWGASFGDQSKIAGKEYWLKKSGSTEVLRVAFLTNNASFSEDQVRMMTLFLSSLTWK
jgi:hypothetical protein